MTLQLHPCSVSAAGQVVANNLPLGDRASDASGTAKKLPCAVVVSLNPQSIGTTVIGLRDDQLKT